MMNAIPDRVSLRGAAEVTPPRRSRKRRAAHACYIASLIIIPVVVAVLTPIVPRVLAYHLIAELPPGESFYEATIRIRHLFQYDGVFGFALFILDHLGAFGIIIILSLLLARRWNAGRVYFFLLSAMLIPLSFAAANQWRAATVSVDSIRQIGSSMEGDWFAYWVGYPPYALVIGLLTGWIVSYLPILWRGPRYWLARGMCPKCHYDLKGEIGRGCPECGWKRPPESAGID